MQPIKRNSGLRLRIGAAAVLLAASAQAAAVPQEAALTPLRGLRVRGYVGARMDACFRGNLVATDIPYITAPYARKSEFWHWDCEFWGKFMHSAMPLRPYLRDAAFDARVDAGVRDVIATQLPDGYIGNFAEEFRARQGLDIWCCKYTMLGLLHAYDATGDRSALEAACRLADWLAGECPGKRPLHETGGVMGLDVLSSLEPIVWLYRRTGEKKYLEYAGYIVSEMNDLKDGPMLIDQALKGVDMARRPWRRPAWKYGGLKAYEMMSCYQGLLDYYEETGDRRCFDAAYASAENIANTEVNICGGMASCEMWYGGAANQTRPYRRLQETCCTTTWLRLCEKLLAMTGEPKWADRMETTLFNAYLASLSPDGSVFSTYCPLAGTRRRGQNQCWMRTNCCNANGPRGFLAFMETILTARGTDVFVNQYAPCTASMPVPGLGGARVRFEIATDYPREDHVSMRYDGDAPLAFALNVRIPAWAADPRVELNEPEGMGLKKTPVKVARAGAYFAVSREWKPGDILNLSFGMPVAAHELDGHVAFTRGPLVLARDLRFADGDIGESIRRPFRFAPGDFSAVVSPTCEIYLTCVASLELGHHYDAGHGRVQRKAVRFCDYASAGNTWDERSAYRVWMPFDIAPECINME